MVEQHAKLVAAQPGDEVIGTRPGEQFLGDMNQGGVATHVTELVVQYLEIVKVDKQHGSRNAMPLVPRDHYFQLAKHPPAVGKRNQRVAMGEHVQLGNLCLESRHIGAKTRYFFQQLYRVAPFQCDIVHAIAPAIPGLT